MAITINWPTKVINVPKADLTLIQSTPTEIRQLDINTFRLTLKDLEDSDDGMAFVKTHVHQPPVSVGGVQLARVVEIINDYTVTFEDGQYAVNLAGANSNIGDRVNVNQVSVRSANSAGLVQSSEIEYSSFGGGVTMDVVNGKAGQAYPIGTAESPVNNLDDAKFIAGLRGFDKIFVRGSYEFLPSDTADDLIFIGQTPEKSLLTLTAAASITNCTFLKCKITGELDGGTTVRECVITTLNYVDGLVHECEFETGVISLAGVQADFINCYSGVAGNGASTPVIDMNGTGTALSIRNYSGGLKITNYTSGNDPVSIDMLSGNVIIDSTVTSGLIVVRGVGKLTNNATGSAQVIQEIIDPLHMNSQSFTDGAIWVDPTSSNTGSLFPVGTPKEPVNNWSDAALIRDTEHLKSFRILSSLTLSPTDDISECHLIGDNPIKTILVLQGGNTTFADLERMTVAGQQNGRIYYKRECILSNITNFAGGCVNAILAGNLTADPAFTGELLFLQCGSAVAGTGKPILDMSTSPANIQVRDYVGSIKIKNFSQGSSASFDFLSGNLFLDSTSTSGTIVVRGNAKVIDDDTGNEIPTGTFNGLTIVNDTTKKQVWDYSG